MSARPTVLVVDGDAEARRAAAEALAADAWRIVYAANVEAATRWLAEEPVSVILAEIALPGPSGLLLLAEARRVHPDVARVATAVDADVDVALRAINDAEVLRFLRKPAGAAQVREAAEAGLAWSESMRAARGAREAAARRGAFLAALAAEHPDLVPAAAGPDGYGIPPHRVGVLAERLAGTPLGALLAAARTPGSR